MRVIGSVQFEEDEVETFLRALKGHEHALQVETDTGARMPVRARLNQIKQGEPFDLAALEDLNELLGWLIQRWQAQTTPEAWQALGAPGSQSAIEGLAQERVNAVARAVAARELVEAAHAKVSALSTERRETRADQRESA